MARSCRAPVLKEEEAPLTESGAYPGRSFPKPRCDEWSNRSGNATASRCFQSCDSGQSNSHDGVRRSLIRPRGGCRNLSEALVLTFPNELRFLALVRLVLSGLAAQIDLPYEQVDDLQLTVEGALAGEAPSGDEVTLRIEPGKEALSVWIRPIGVRPATDDRLERSDGLDFDRIAGKLVDAVEIVTLDGNEWLRLEKRIPENASGAGSRS